MNMCLNHHFYLCLNVQLKTFVKDQLNDFFLTVENIMARRRNGATNAKEIYALSGRIFCECGAAMSGTRIGARGNKYIYYACSNQKNKHGNCDVSMVRKDKIEYVVYLAIVDYIKAHKQSIITEVLNQSENREEKVRADELRKKSGYKKTRLRTFLPCMMEQMIWF